MGKESCGCGWRNRKFEQNLANIKYILCKFFSEVNLQSHSVSARPSSAKNLLIFMIYQGVSMTGIWKLQYLLDWCSDFSSYSSSTILKFLNLDCRLPSLVKVDRFSLNCGLELNYLWPMFAKCGAKSTKSRPNLSMSGASWVALNFFIAYFFFCM